MKKARKMTALLLVLLLMTAVLCACGGTKCSICGKTIRGQSYNTAAGIICESCYLSGASLGASSGRSNTGVWIAITVMVFVAVFAATSGVVYLVLQKVLPPEEPEHDDLHSTASRGYAQPKTAFSAPPVRSSAPRPQQTTAAAPRPQQSVRPQQPAPRPQQSAPRPQQPVAPRPQTAQANARTYTGEWICSRDHSRNSGPYCVLCGAPRPRPTANAAVQQPVQRPAQQQYTQQPVQRPAQQQYTQQPVQRPAQQQYAQQPVQRPAQQYAQQPTQQYDYQADASLWEEPAVRPAQQPVTQEVEEPEVTYTGKFAKKTAPAPEADQTDFDDGAFDADLLEAILREAEQGE